MTQEILTLSHIEKTFNKGTINQNQVLKGIDLTVNEGDFITIIGGNGAGKSTLLNSIAGNFLPDAGRISIKGNDVTKLKEHQRAALVGRVFQDPRMGTASRMTVGENMSMAYRRGQKRTLRKGNTQKERTYFKEQLAQLGLGLENRIDSEIGLLSGGQRQAITLLMATLKKPAILLLDEHTAALDPKTAKVVLDLTNQRIQNEGLTTLMITHNMKDALTYGNRLIMLDYGKVVVDITGDKKSQLSVNDVMNLFQTATKDGHLKDDMLLGS
ncbi:ABC transporter ATP-binding protein [Carnobacterium divergens]|uniref:ABC transporter ATP-binding protein n=1 Tax=Carnobacterium divergens TaxID=2748 RepID=A0A7Z8CY70_CARDV|nr:ABC transporter ATP-binding protein [Carnobacterium divergens]TFI71378.1 ABC transporter ATP-binding protein [Carnobacterium divergens]TFI76020.1 ABC transporter ATP-binding protein [Carnobacterium divergens]TFI81892.1 ABC transporter ATP-binding protein [Carnobacterium divergens]TFI94201.1 ABC transporter ATP-binding protein [Carnobacterium divergens]TFJ10481.1 ABC transporter ATP-binding protein [Carnobacterium divergens]